MISPKSLFYRVVRKDGKWWGVLNRGSTFRVGIQGSYSLRKPGFSCDLKNGFLTVNRHSRWDFATGAIDTEDMRIASLLHDAFCNMYNEDIIPFGVRRKADVLFRKVLKEQGCPFIRRWYAYLAVSAYTYTREIGWHIVKRK